VTTFLQWHWERITRTAHDLLAPYLDDLGPAPRVLDLGCGNGRQIADILTRFERPVLVGVDASHDSLRRARERNPERAGFVQADAEHADSLFAQPFDLVHQYGMSEMVKDMPGFFSAALHALRPGGLFLCSYGLPGSMGSRIYSASMARAGLPCEYAFSSTQAVEALVRTLQVPSRLVAQVPIWHYYAEGPLARVPTPGRFVWNALDRRVARRLPPSGLYALVQRL